MKLITRQDVLDQVGVSYPTIWSMMRHNEFPRSVRVGGRAMWHQTEIDDWIESRPRTRLKGDDPAEPADAAA